MNDTRIGKGQAVESNGYFICLNEMIKAMMSGMPRLSMPNANAKHEPCL